MYGLSENSHMKIILRKNPEYAAYYIRNCKYVCKTDEKVIDIVKYTPWHCPT